MVNGYSAQQMRDAEAPHLAAGEPLMQRAAAALAQEIRSVLVDRAGDLPGCVLLLVGSGDNGGDALYAGAVLASTGCDVTILPVGSRMHEAGLTAALAAGAQVIDVTEADGTLDALAVANAAADADVIVDGILGTGAASSPALRGTARDVVAAILPVLPTPGAPSVVAVDIPSGIGPDDGSIPDPVVLPADVTVTFGGFKAGLLLPPASTRVGEVRLVDIGLGPDLARVQPLVHRHG
ncbi:MAG TPA: NAD(P)H-hydrate epimerase [Humibacter sp.]|nr:NAD(P)H-hydrate epimerase [Humibacter sp.]